MLFQQPAVIIPLSVEDSFPCVFYEFITMFLIFNEIFIAYIGLTLSYLQQYILQLSESIYTDENRLKNSRPIIFLFAEKEKVTFSICMLFRRHSSFL